MADSVIASDSGRRGFLGANSVQPLVMHDCTLCGRALVAREPVAEAWAKTVEGATTAVPDPHVLPHLCMRCADSARVVRSLLPLRADA